MSNQFKLLNKRRFLPLFLTQFLGAFNDNVYKNAVIILIAFTAFDSHFSSNTLINFAGGLFILPFFLFSASFGQLADKIDKAKLVRLAKLLEIVIAILATGALLLHNLTLLLSALFLLGTQSTLFGPVKYSILPQHLKYNELVGGNGLIEASTFIAILTGTLFGGLLIAIPHSGAIAVSIAIFAIALLGFITSQFVPTAPSHSPDLKVNWNIFSSTWQNLKFAKQNKNVFLAVLGISWFWFYGAFMFYQVPNYTKHFLGGNAHVATLLIATYAVGIGLGSLICEKLSRKAIEVGLVPIAAVVISVFTADLYYLQPAIATQQGLTVSAFFQNSHHVLIFINIFIIGIASGLFTVPLYTLIQARSKKEQRSRIIAANNILNALLMVFAALFAIGLLHFGVTIPQLFLILAVLNACVTIYIFSVSLEYIFRMIVFVMVSLAYRLKVTGQENLDVEGPVIYACNHISFVDVLVMSTVSKRPIRFLMDHRLFQVPVLHTISKIGKAIPIATHKEDPEMKAAAFKAADKVLKGGGVIGIFPEGSITRDGKIALFKKGLEQIIESAPAPVVPMALEGMWGSFFSRKYNGRAMSVFPKRFWSKIRLNIGKPIPPEEFSIERLQEEIQRLHDEAEEKS